MVMVSLKKYKEGNKKGLVEYKYDKKEGFGLI